MSDFMAHTEVAKGDVASIVKENIFGFQIAF